MHPFRFGVVLESVHDTATLIATLDRAELDGYSTALIRDHLVAEPFGPQLAPLTTLAVAAAHSTRLRLGAMVIDNDFRHPALLAKEIATLDVLSGGRVELGLGAGWLADEYRHAGIPFDSPGTRIARLKESLTIMKGLLQGDRVSYRGDYYQIDDLQGYPPSVQRPHPPIFLGGGGRKMLSLAGREANIVGLLTSSTTFANALDDPLQRRTDRVVEKIGWVREAAGDRFPTIELSLFPDITVTTDRNSAARRVATANGWTGIDPEVIFDMPAIVIGTVDEVVEALQQRREQLGFSYLIFGNADMETVAPIVARLAGT
jgi:probable F420-dependent oxidoreductase